MRNGKMKKKITGLILQFFRKGSGWNDVDIYNKSVGASG